MTLWLLSRLPPRQGQVRVGLRLGHAAVEVGADAGARRGHALRAGAGLGPRGRIGTLQHHASASYQIR